ncbi:hypothetical protein EW145_g1752 [Phellinidium pouzarii]|uniref:Glycopeptide n=1 Tax=Phellinidium pouzarii TaxID=167371 RepID=A0A4S4LIT5_9AGAM|nr:hypothetical protein EW145_g1752 [Phellinidium pouzarii]
MLSILLPTVLLAVIGAHAETHETIVHTAVGSPMLIQGQNVLSTGGTYVSNGPLISAIAYLQTGGCGFNGEGCTLIETTLVNPTTPGSGSSTDISLIPPLTQHFMVYSHSFSVTSGFGYFPECAPAGADCTNADCTTAFHQPGDTGVQVACQADNVNLAITFCD